MRDLRSTLPVILLTLLAGCSSTPSKPTPTPEGLTESASFTIRVKQILRVELGGSGEGTLIFEGWQYTFNIENTTLSGVGNNPVDLEGTVYNLENLEDFNGIYTPETAEIKAGKGLTGIWTRNEKGVVAHLRPMGQNLNLNFQTQGAKVTLQK